MSLHVDCSLNIILTSGYKHKSFDGEIGFSSFILTRSNELRLKQRGLGGSPGSTGSCWVILDLTEVFQGTKVTGA